MAGYTRTDTTNNIADGNIINATDLDNEFDAIQGAFNASTGHNHDGTTGEGAPILAVGPAQDVVVGSSSVTPKTTGTVDLGTPSLKFKDLNLSGDANIAGTINGTAVPATKTLVTTVDAQTLTNKRIDTRVSSATSTSTLTPNIALFDQYNLTAQAASLTVAAPTGTPVDGNRLIIRLLDNGTSRAISWNATYTPIGVTLPTATIVNKTMYIGCIYNANNTRWDVVAVVIQG